MFIIISQTEQQGKRVTNCALLTNMKKVWVTKLSEWLESYFENLTYEQVTLVIQFSSSSSSSKTPLGLCKAFKSYLVNTKQSLAQKKYIPPFTEVQ